MEIGIVGATGYGGVELFRLLNGHPEVKTIKLYSSTQSGEFFQEIYSHVNNEEYVLQELAPEQMKEQLDIIFLATPAGVSSELTPQLTGGKGKVIDLSGDLRLKDREAYTNWYKNEAATEEIIEQSVYGLPEWNKEEIQSAEIIANPGCYPTATLIGLGPVLNKQLADPSRIIIDAKSGVSGAGKKASPVTHFANTQENFRIYKVNQHQHIPEIEQQLLRWDADAEPVTFSTHLVPMTRGIMSTIYVDLKASHSLDELVDLYQQTYQDEPFVRVRKAGEFPCTRDVYASNYCDIGLALDERTGRLTIVAVIDNLMKGAASQAVQNMNLVLGLNETTGLTHISLYP
ncbi:N-acetyl-gamma-glutamyl-phosphate reductase [Halobacillus andaensis]|uniref:N-acetyl-gamma-glutamyl-phosphate reductase n=1 Tax=Halobacillus andaensis TaxID=1176239 RepID=A0A917B3X2_HALAA|nr:N-acetyl-gamma-glutamyl-phosphate reductase [Halobacillus andaensis]MBP2004633.1 N-acetyl-gamma-glutamyl-phosphate reductase [Halobacillus andaensis]GGF20159.1 N-acetyl-gamma-glutamyl-phosphate reductase [Halobacillus andaensis]